MLAGRTQTTDEHTFGIVIFQAQNYNLAVKIMEEDPAVKHGVMSCRLYPYAIAVASPALQLMANQNKSDA